MSADGALEFLEALHKLCKDAVPMLTYTSAQRTSIIRIGDIHYTIVDVLFHCRRHRCCSYYLRRSEHDL